MSNLSLNYYIIIIQDLIDKIKNSFSIIDEQEIKNLNKLNKNLYKIKDFLDEYIFQRKNKILNQSSLKIYVSDFQPRMKKQFYNLDYFNSKIGLDDVNVNRIKYLINNLDKLHIFKINKNLIIHENKT